MLFKKLFACAAALAAILTASSVFAEDCISNGPDCWCRIRNVTTNETFSCTFRGETASAARQSGNLRNVSLVTDDGGGRFVLGQVKAYYSTNGFATAITDGETVTTTRTSGPNISRIQVGLRAFE